MFGIGKCETLYFRFEKILLTWVIRAIMRENIRNMRSVYENTLSLEAKNLPSGYQADRIHALEMSFPKPNQPSFI
jgi:hypothetical protein